MRNTSTPQAPTSVARLNETIRGFVERWGSIWVEGEVTSWNVRGGHVFGRLKDSTGDAHISFRLWSSTLQRMLAEIVEVGDTLVALPMNAAGVTLVIGDVTLSGS